VAYRGRFAPSPTGDLHFGSLLAALASYLDARAHQGQWLVRIEDVDETRTVAGSADRILRTLENLGFNWDETPAWQSRRKPRYAEVLDELRSSGSAYPCGCTRAQVAELGRPGAEGPIYPGTCRQGMPSGTRERSLRLRVRSGTSGFIDRVHGRVAQVLDRDVGDFVIRRADGFTAYQLAVVVDDNDQGITHVVRGADLLASTPRQIYLQELLGYRHPGYAHVPLIVDPTGRKLSKRDQAPGIAGLAPVGQLVRAFRALGQVESSEPVPDSIDGFWPWAQARWDISKIGSHAISVDTL
jgi:glutamyl-Q tRNA(Asp) synthetase